MSRVLLFFILLFSFEGLVKAQCPNTVTDIDGNIYDVIEIGGVIIPSASNAAPPSMAGITSHFRCLLTSVYNENIPPSPLLSARSVSMIYLNVV